MLLFGLRRTTVNGTAATSARAGGAEGDLAAEDLEGAVSVIEGEAGSWPCFVSMRSARN